MSRRRLNKEGGHIFGRRVRQVRGARRQDDFARELDVSRAALANYEAGRRLPKGAILDRLAALSGQTPDWFLYGLSGRSPSIPEIVASSVAKRAPRTKPVRAQAQAPAHDRAPIREDELAILAVVRLAAIASLHVGPLLALIEAAETAISSGRIGDIGPADLFSLSYLKREIRSQAVALGDSVPPERAGGMDAAREDEETEPTGPRETVTPDSPGP